MSIVLDEMKFVFVAYEVETPDLREAHVDVASGSLERKVNLVLTDPFV